MSRQISNPSPVCLTVPILLPEPRERESPPPEPEPERPRTGPTEHEKKKLAEWWERYHGGRPDESVTVAQMTAKFFNPPAQWSRRAIEGQQHVNGLDNPDTFASQVRAVLGITRSSATPLITVRVLRFEWQGGVRGELLLLPGTPNDRYNAIIVQLGHVELVGQGRIPGPPFSLQRCPTPQEIDPPGRTWLNGTRAELQKKRRHPPLPLSLEALIPDEDEA